MNTGRSALNLRMTVMGGIATLCGAAGLYPLYSGRPWFWSGVGAVLAVMGGGLLARRFPLHPAFSLLAGLAALLVYLTLRFTAGEALLGVVPTPGSVSRLGALLSEGWDAANRYAAPVPLVPGIALLTTAGIGLVAVTVDLLAARLRRAAPAGLPLLAMYSVPAAVREDSINVVAFGIGAAGYLALLVADSRENVGGWGRVVYTRRWTEAVPMAGNTTSQAGRTRPDSSALAASGRRIGLAAVAIAVLVPVAVPGIHPRGLFGMGTGGGRGGGTQTVTTPDPLVSLKRELTRADDSVVLTYRTTDPRPDYLRLYSLDRFDGDRWTYSPLESTARDRLDRLFERRLPPPPGLTRMTGVTVVQTSIRIQRRVRDLTFLPLPYAPAQVSIEGDWRVDPQSLMVYSLRDSAGGRSYDVTSLRAQPTPEQLADSSGYPNDIIQHYTRVPRNIPPQIHQLARDVTNGATSAHDQAVRLQRWFTTEGGFQYDLAAPPPQHGNDLVDFLQNTKRGYCEQYAAAMALLARILGIPSRVAMGYTPGTQTSRDTWVVRSRDAHAWPELYFPGTGWVRFEPTPSGPAGQGTAFTPPYSDPNVTGEGGQQEEPTSPVPTDSASADPSAAPEQAQRDQPEDLGPAGLAEQRQDDDGLPWGWIAAGLLAALILSAPMTARALMRRRRWAAAVLGRTPAGGPAPKAASMLGRWRRRPAPGTAVGGPRENAAGREFDGVKGRSRPDPAEVAHAAWQEMRADALDHGLPWRASDSPRATVRRLGEHLELDTESAKALGRIARAEELARYARSLPPAPAESLQADVKAVRQAFASAVGRRARLRARYLPPSSIATFGSTWSRVLEAASRLNTAIAERVARAFLPPADR
ncbi:transglutaminase [Actinomadura sp. NBRC 104412]|uniref:transglutaminase TgpA family protein n=1 Tax=Actinomadura sp. NBRC 104412 TaxID=3032203 RepID=UPI0024A36575|nr:transglutaminaseTgpA domain-containing protein [Actinomadura sp. NBRC 104412]GLZ03623.1 transglutaminase [Actinomadura sp. NBRC 104412]